MKGSILKRGDGIYLIRLSIGYRTLPNGKRKRKYKTVTFHGPRKEAEARMRALVAQYESGGVINQDMTPLLDYLVEWMELAKSTSSSATKRSYNHYIKNRIGPVLGDLPLCRVTPMEIQRFYRDLSASESALNTCHTILNQAFRQAVRWRRIPANPVTSLEKPRPKRVKRRKEGDKAFSREELAIFLERVKGERDGMLFRLAFYSGARPGEYLALQWPAVDWAGGNIWIEENLTKEVGKPAVLGPVKTKASVRPVHLPSFIMAELRQYRTRVLEARMANADKWDSTYDLVFPNLRTGRPRCEGAVNERAKRLYKKFEISVLDLYALRHSFATAHLFGKEPIKSVSALMGHSTIAITANVYSHYQSEMGRAAADSLGRLFPG